VKRSEVGGGIRRMGGGGQRGTSERGKIKGGVADEWVEKRKRGRVEEGKMGDGRGGIREQGGGEEWGEGGRRKECGWEIKR